MSDIVIRVENLSKKYTIGRANNGRANGEGLRHALQRAATAPFRTIGKLGKQKAESQNNFSFKLSSVSSQNSSQSEEFFALKDVSFDVKRGEVLGIIGRNGAGKSTLLKILSRITEPTSGRIGIKGRIASLLEVGTGFHPELTGRENIFLNGAILGMSRVEVKRKFDEIVAFAEVEQFLDTPVKRYSSGMYVRLAFAVAAHLEPEILVVDEVLAVGDAQFQNKCLGKMQDVASCGRTVLFVSHFMHSIKALCHRALLLRAGCLIGNGAVDEVIVIYRSRVGKMDGNPIGTNKVTGISLLNAQIKADENNDALNVSATFHLSKVIPNCGLGVHVETSSGMELCYLRPETTGLCYGNVSGGIDVRFRLYELSQRLGAGSYTLSLSMHETNWRCSFERTPIGEFVVPATDIFGTGYPPKLEKDGPLVLPLRIERVGKAQLTMTIRDE